MTLSRRRLITIAAAMAGTAALPARAAVPYEWRGVALGTPARLILRHPDRAAARRLVADCLAEIERLEGIFSLYRPSALTRLNDTGRLEAPPLDLVRVLAQARRMSELSGGAFDVTVQPLWRLHAEHGGTPPADAVERARRLVDWRDLEISPARIALARPGMAVTLNGIAQGAVTDRVAERLRAAGLMEVLVSLGEVRGLGAWRVGLPDGGTVELSEGAVATSSPDGTRFGPTAHHLFDPATGASSRHARTVTVLADTATLADSASTAMAVMPPDAAAVLARSLGVRTV